MKSFVSYLNEAFPLKKTGSGKPPAAGGASPATEQGPQPANGFGDDQSNAQFAALQQAKAEKERAEAEARAAKDAEEAAEVAKVKEMRAAAAQRVVDDLNSQFNQNDDEVIFYPPVPGTFSGHLDKEMGLDGKSADTDDHEDPDADDAKQDEDKDADTDESDDTSDDDDDDSKKSDKKIVIKVK